MNIAERISQIQVNSDSVGASRACVETLRASGLSTLIDEISERFSDVETKISVIENGDKVVKTITWDKGSKYVFIGVRDGVLTFHGNKVGNERFFRKVEIDENSAPEVEEAFTQALSQPLLNVQY